MLTKQQKNYNNLEKIMTPKIPQCFKDDIQFKCLNVIDFNLLSWLKALNHSDVTSQTLSLATSSV